MNQVFGPQFYDYIAVPNWRWLLLLDLELFHCFWKSRWFCNGNKTWMIGIGIWRHPCVSFCIFRVVWLHKKFYYWPYLWSRIPQSIFSSVVESTRRVLSGQHWNHHFGTQPSQHVDSDRVNGVFHAEELHRVVSKVMAYLHAWHLQAFHLLFCRFRLLYTSTIATLESRKLHRKSYETPITWLLFFFHQWCSTMMSKDRMLILLLLSTRMNVNPSYISHSLI